MGCRHSGCGPSEEVRAVRRAELRQPLAGNGKLQVASGYLELTDDLAVADVLGRANVGTSHQV
jgi:hypothetical protein